MKAYVVPPLVVILVAVGGAIGSVPALIEYPPDFGLTPTQRSHHATVLDRLPESINPSVVKLEMKVILNEGAAAGEQPFTAPGKVWITGIPFNTTTPITAITLNYRNIAIKNESTTIMDVRANSLVTIVGQEESPEKEMFTINLAQPLISGREYTVFVEFVSIINSEPTSFYYSTYRDQQGNVHYLASTDFQAPDARQAFPCMDEPQFKPQWDISIIRLNNYTSLSNMDRLSTDTVGLPAGWSRDVYNRTVPMSSYLVAFAVSKYKVAMANSSLYGKPVGIWGPPELIDNGEASYSPDFSAKLMRFMEEYYQVDYSISKMDKISIPNFSSGAMENWGLNTYRPSRLLHVEGRDTLQDFFSLTNTISHELVHQWFGNLITCRWWDDLWVQEGAATYYAPVGVAGVGEGRLLPMETLITASVQRSFLFDSDNTLTHPIHNTGVDPSDVAVLFDTLTYHKGAALIRMMNAFLTESVYTRAMTTLINRFAFGSVTQDDMFAVLDEVAAGVPSLLPAGFTVAGIMRSWTLKRGFPVLSVYRDVTQRVDFTQSHFIRNASGTPDPTLWTIPVALFVPGETSVNPRPVFWLMDNQTSVSRVIRDSWFIVNPQSQGYYRVEYKGPLLDQLIEQLHSNHTVIDVQTRSQLVDDNINLAFAGYVELVKALNLTMYLQNERQLFPFVSFVTNMATPYKLFARSSAYPAFKNYILTLVSDALEEIGFDVRPGEEIPTTMLRTRLYEWACNNGHLGCIAHAKRTFENWVANPSNVSAVFPDLQATIYCTAVANGGDVEWNFVYQQYLTSIRDLHQLSLLRALACSKTSFRLNNLLDRAIDPTSGIRAAQRVPAMQAVAGNSAGTDITFNFIRNNYDTIVRRFGLGMVNSVLTTIAGSFSLALERSDLERFLTSKPDLSRSSLSVVDGNIQWMASHFVIFRDFISTLSPAEIHKVPLEWWQESIVYQIYPRSFQDSDGDGVGDINGITSRLNYFTELGVNAIWISPIYQSPMKDFGYDISNFTAIEPIFGTIDDFTVMAAEFRKKGLKLVMDFVPNHSSDLHPWFIKSANREDPYTDYYVWKDPIGYTPTGQPIPPNNWTSVFGGSMWEWHAGRNQFYLHQFVKEQPDLNFENRVVWDEILDAVRFWLDKGVDGFRVDAVPHMFEDQRYLDEPPNPDRDPEARPDEHRYYLHPYTFNLPQVLDFLAEFRQLVDDYSKADGTRRVMMVEATVGLPDLMEYYGTPERPIAHFPFNFHLLGVQPQMTAREVLDLLDIWNVHIPEGQWATTLIGNHDNRRAATRFTQDGVDLANMLNLLVKGTAVTYYGEEIGMEDTWISWEDTVDPAGCNMGPDRYETFSRDPARTPMQWDDTKNSGFSSGNRTWLPLNSNYINGVNVLNQTTGNGDSHLKVYKAIVNLRSRAVWKYGDYKSNATNDAIVFTRTTTSDIDPISFAVIANFANNTISINAQQMVNLIPPQAQVAITSVSGGSINVGDTILTNQTTLAPKQSIVVTFPSS